MATIPRNYVRLDGSERKPSQGARLLGPADEHETFMVTILVRRRPDGPPLPDYDYFLRTHPARRRRLSSDEFADKYGAAPDDLKKVSDFAAARGLTVLETHPARRTVVVSGTVTQMNHAFGVSLGRYEHEVVRRRGARPHTETYRGRDGFIHIPADLAQVIVGVFGLDNRRIEPTAAPAIPEHDADQHGTVTSLTTSPPTRHRTNDRHPVRGRLPPERHQPDVRRQSANDDRHHGRRRSNLRPSDLAKRLKTSVSPRSQRRAPRSPSISRRPPIKGLDRLDPSPGTPERGRPGCSVMSSSFYVSNGDDLPTLANESISVAWLNAMTMAFNDAGMQAVTVCIAAGDTGSNSKVGANPAAWASPSRRWQGPRAIPGKRPVGVVRRRHHDRRHRGQQLR